MSRRAASVPLWSPLLICARRAVRVDVVAERGGCCRGIIDARRIVQQRVFQLYAAALIMMLPRCCCWRSVL